MFIIDIYSFIKLLLNIPQLHINFFVIFHDSKALAKCLLQLLKNAIRMIL